MMKIKNTKLPMKNNKNAKKVRVMSKESKAEPPGTRTGPGSRTGKIARLPRHVRNELNQRLLDGESGTGLIQWLNELPEAKAALQRDFGGRPINDQNLSDWKQGGFRDWVAKTEAEELLDDTLAEGRECKREHDSRAPASRRKGSREKAVEIKTVSDKVADWFFPHYVAAARGQMAAAQTPAGRWSVLRTICADLASLRRSDHYVERLRIWQEKLRLETKVATAEEKEITEKEFLKWARTQPDLEQKLWPDREYLTYEEKEQAMNQILGISPRQDFTHPGKGDSGIPVQAPVPDGEGNPGDAEKG
jgi:hypothetical protein